MTITKNPVQRRPLTLHQLMVLRIIIKGNPDNGGNSRLVDLDEIIDRCARTKDGKLVMKQSMQITLKVLEMYGLIAKVGRDLRRTRSHVVFAATDFGRGVGEDRVGYAFVGDDED